MRKREQVRFCHEQHSHLFPDGAHQIGDIFRIGVMPPYTDAPAEMQVLRFPHQRSESRAIVENLRNDIRGRQAFVVDLGEIQKREMVEFTPAHTVLKRNPDRPIRKECRATSDLRRATIWLRKVDTFPAWVLSIMQIPARVVEWKTRYPGIEVLIAKRRPPMHLNAIHLIQNAQEPSYILLTPRMWGARFSFCIGLCLCLWVPCVSVVFCFN